MDSFSDQVDDPLPGIPPTPRQMATELMSMRKDDIVVLKYGLEQRRVLRVRREKAVRREEAHSNGDAEMKPCSYCHYLFDVTATGDGRCLSATVYDNPVSTRGYVIALSKYEVCEECYYDDMESLSLAKYTAQVADLALPCEPPTTIILDYDDIMPHSNCQCSDMNRSVPTAWSSNIVG